MQESSLPPGALGASLEVVSVGPGGCGMDCKHEPWEPALVIRASGAGLVMEKARSLGL